MNIGIMANVQLTFDDGPLGDGSNPVYALTTILQVLQRKGVKAAFFVLGNEVDNRPSLVNQIINSAPGHIVGNHSWSHPHALQITEQQILQEFLRTHNRVRQAVQISMSHWRAPFLEGVNKIDRALRSNSALRSYLSHCDVHADSKDSQGRNTADSMLDAILSDMRGMNSRTNFRVLFHVKTTTADSLERIIRGLESNHHTIVNFAQTS